MKKYFMVRIINIFITLFIIASATFFLMKKLPGSPFDEEKLAALPEAVRMQMYSQYGLDQPVTTQYFLYLKGLVLGNLGKSFYFNGQPVTELIAKQLGPSLLIGFQALLLGLMIGITLGIIAALRHNSFWDYSTMVIAVFGVSVPNFVVGALLQYYAGLKWGLFPVAFWESYNSSLLPTIALTFGVIAVIARFMRNEMIEVLQQDYIFTAKAKGLGNLVVVFKHAIRNALIPVITVLGPITVSLLTGSLVIEKIFVVPGIGGLFVDAIKYNDYSTIMALTLFFSAFYIIVILIIDILYGMIDPRILLTPGKE